MNIHQQFAAYWSDDYILAPYAYWAHKSLNNGNICFTFNELNQKEEIQQHYNFVHSNIQNSPFVTIDPKIIKPFILYQDRFYIYKYFQYETKILEAIKQFNQYSENLYTKRVNTLSEIKSFDVIIDSSLSQFEANSPITDWQFVGAMNGYLQQFSILTGGPGTGKTTTIAKLLWILQKEDPSLKVAMTAQTGKAAARMLESLEKNNIYNDHLIALNPPKASTLHKLLGYKHLSPYFKHNKENPLPYDVVIVDEASMVDVPLFAKLLDAINPATTRVIVLGDQNQLVSIEAGSLLKDFCDSTKTENNPTVNQFNNNFVQFINSKLNNHFIPSTSIHNNSNNPLIGKITGLEISRRFDRTSFIGQLSHAILQENVEQVKEFIQQKKLKTNKELVQFNENDTDADLNYFVNLYENFIKEPNIEKAIEKLNSVRILCAVRQGLQGIHHYNQLVETALQNKKIIEKDEIFYENRPILVTKNNSALDLYNGDVGIIRKDKQNNGIATAYFLKDRKIKSVPAALLNDIETVYAMTIHKSQGSEFNHVLMVLPKSQDSKLLTKELIYTGITRAKKELFIESNKDVLLNGITRKINRASGVVERLNQN